MIDKQLLIDVFNKYNITLNEMQVNQLVDYYNMLIETNKVINLTAITEWPEVVYKHYLDSVLPYKIIPYKATLLDIGAGAGFPSIPLKIIRPDLNVVMLDSLNKRINFLNQVIDKLQLVDIQAVHGRAEDYIKVSRETFDVVVARAVAEMSTLAEYCIPYVKIGGIFVAYKSDVTQELDNAVNAIKILGGKVSHVDTYIYNENTRSIVVVDKIKSTALKYPRGQNKPRTNPLN